ncbi:MAG: tRNA (N6-threonylcarbamoyladenosine(37)-N6)-methyltransferase TrmO [Calditrichaceae bacterium]|nr:tRNA (N6-threonylcarbamoyladenosine(37)-N6)-methyltransferase TrmO [Calditrichaceae bacterium]MBN2710588.1 tRNA (N6-threonylcarbamoyladenosine(37)-N6)-methyltransferase TrmO [Calditrichaceae bacterium]RQV94779.1 MAG: tRNA (N6-threonylcarbamoyladenosine(37)-N6)-methyltransferase TrmO [Calditrichota bacterium]
MTQICYKPIGIIHSPFKSIAGVPIQPSAANGIKGHIVIDEEYTEGLADLDGFSHIYLLYHFHLSKSYNLKVVPFLDDKKRGVFSTRAPKRPNSIGLSIVRLTAVKSNILEIENIDIIDGTPLLDIKPYVREMEGLSDYKIGWLTEYKDGMKTKNSDHRFK